MLPLILMLASAFAHAGCESLFTFDDPRPMLKGVFRLGEGRYSVTWLRRVAGDFVADKEFGPGSQADGDLAAFKGHAWIVAGSEPTGFRLPPWAQRGVPSQRRPSIIMPGYRIPYYPGRTVADLVMDEGGTPAEFRARVRLRYLQAFSRYRRLVERKLGPHRAYDWTYASKLPWLLVHVPIDRPSVEVTIRPDNIIVDPWTLEMTIIDPY